MTIKKSGIFTKVVHGSHPERIKGAVNTPIFQASTFLTTKVGQPEDVRYTRLNNNPSQLAVSQKIADLENTEAAVVTASGMAAITTALMSVLNAGDHVLFQRSLYGGTHAFAVNDLPAMGIAFDFVDASDPDNWKAKLRPETRAIYVESITNPTMEVVDFAEVIRFAKAHNLISLIDNTFASPVNFRPAEIGFDIVLHSCTKYLNGHSDIIAGAICGSESHIANTLPKLNRLGGSLDPHACFLLERGMKTLAVRMAQHNRNAMDLGQFLVGHPKVLKVNYPGLPASSTFRMARRFFDGYGGMLSFEVSGGADAALQLVQSLELAIFAPSLGSVETLVTLPAQTSHIGMTPAERQALGISDGLIRVSVGIESTGDLISDFARALSEI